MARPQEDTLRLFVALPPPRHVVERLKDLQDHLRGESWQVKWTDPAQFHVTLHFLGKTPVRVVDDLQRELSACAHALRPFEVEAAGLGVFPNEENPRVIYAGIDDRHGKLRDLFDRTHRILSRYRLFSLPKDYTPHVTLGRVKELKNWDPRRLAALRADWKRLGRYPVEGMVMMKSTLGSEGSVHEAMFTAGLGGEQ